MFLPITIFISAFIIPTTHSFLFSSQTVKISGQFFCPSKPKEALGITVTLKDKDTGNIDDTLARVKTDREGRFRIEASARDSFGNIDPELYVYHDCNDYNRFGIPTPCDRKWKFIIPDLYVKNDKEMDIGRINLELIQDDESHDCFHRRGSGNG